MNDLTLAASPWKFGINDPSFIAWLIFFVYFLTAILCWRAPASAHTDKEQRSPFLWKVLSFYLILLGLNKQLDLHQLLLEFGRDLIAEEGQQNYSTMLLGGIIALVGVFGIGVFLLGFKFLSGASRNLCWAYAVFVGLLGFQVLRFLPGPISGVLLAHVFTEEDGLLHIHIIELLELASLLGIGWLARIHRRIGFQPV